MTKDGRPSRLKDIRLFWPRGGEWEEGQELTAFARRLCWWLNSEGFGILLAGKVKVARRSVDLVSRTSTPARMVADSHGGDLSWNLADFVEAERPVLSSLLTFR